MAEWEAPTGNPYMSSHVVGPRTWVVTRGYESEKLWNVLDAEGKEVMGSRADVEIRITMDDNDTGRATRVEINHVDGLTGSELRRLPWSNLLTAADAALRGPAIELTLTESGSVLLDDVVASTASYAMSALANAGSKRPGRPGKPDGFYADIARRYTELRAQGTTNPVRVIANEHQVARDTAGTWVKRARAKGFLPPARPNRAG